MGKRLGLKVSGRYLKVAAIRRWPHLEVRLYWNGFCSNHIINTINEEKHTKALHQEIEATNALINKLIN